MVWGGNEHQLTERFTQGDVVVAKEYKEVFFMICAKPLAKTECGIIYEAFNVETHEFEIFYDDEINYAGKKFGLYEYSVAYRKAEARTKQSTDNLLDRYNDYLALFLAFDDVRYLHKADAIKTKWQRMMEG